MEEYIGTIILGIIIIILLHTFIGII